ncbi:heavy metal translocating P-type ATPase [uncultured Desulfovibrio sp.]|uniref:P-type Zn(2+) transporter n=1 Tax=Candidatus Desulfovibrio intestinavium TaxID=2838534 RepID=A0A9D2HM18_9BACT|nr:heavy metal translocating P-type ATPase [uncultured Desulfovibrio sp.]HJA78324.1 heavy metal translocating P-type ATPase [Candidatus Desulfovibrio intestinavium]
MRFYIVHELVLSSGGRMRVRASRGFDENLARTLHEELAALPEVTVESVNPRVGSLLLYYADDASRTACLRRLLEHSRPEADDRLPAGARRSAARADAGAHGDFPGGQDKAGPPLGGFGPLVRFLFVRPFLPMTARMVSSVMGALPHLKKGLAALAQGRLNVDVLDAAAIAVSLLRRDFRTVTMLTLLLGLGEALEYWTRRRSLASLTESLSLNVEQVWLRQDGVEVCVPLAQVVPGDLVVVRDGGCIPVDGVVEEGEAVVNQASMTGEPLGVPRGVGASVYSGTVVEQGRLVIRAVHVGDGTRLQQVVHFIEESEALKAGIQGKYERMADMAVPFTFGLAALVWLVTRNPLRAASVLLVDYSCALRLATPLAVLAAMREGARHGVVIKGGRFLEALSEADTVVFDKTGTLTNATPRVADVFAAPGQERDEVLRLAACLEEHFPHPVARAVVRKAQEENLPHEEEHAQVEYVVAHGVASMLHGMKVRVGSRHYIEHDEGVSVDGMREVLEAQTRLGRSLLYLAVNGRLAGIIAIEDPLRPEAPAVLRRLREAGLKRILMLTGDDERTARAVAARLGIEEFRAQVLPADKAEVIRELNAQGCRVLMVGDGINDAPALSASHVGLAMCDGADLAREVANVLLTRPSLEGLLTARRLGCGTLKRIRGNFAAAMSLNSLFLLGGLFMLLTPGLSALLHNLTTLGITLNAMRAHLPAPDALEAAEEGEGMMEAANGQCRAA